MAKTAKQEKSLSHAIRDRRATPSFDGTPIPAEDLRKILEAGLSAPSGYNMQPWRFIVVQSEDQKKRLRGAAYNQGKVEEASAVIVACGDADAWRKDLDPILQMGLEGGMPEGYAAQARNTVPNFLSHFNSDEMHGWLNKMVMIAVTHMLLMAEVMGYDTAPMEGFEQEKVHEVLRLPLSYWVVALLAVGHVKGPDKFYGGRFDISHTVFGEEFGKPLKSLILSFRPERSAVEKPATSTRRKTVRAIAVLVHVIVIAALILFYFYPLTANDELIRYHLWRSNIHGEYVDAGPYRLHYFEARPPDGSAGIPLVLIHGLGARGEDWGAMIPSLSAAGFHVYVPDLLGYGRSAKPAVAYSIPLEESVVVDFMQAVHLPRADVGGWSMGGWIAARLALDHPAMVDRLVLYDAAGITYKLSFPRDAFVPTDAAGLDRLLDLLSPHPPHMRGFTVRAALRKIKQQGPIVQQSLDSMETAVDILDQRLAALQQPTLLIWGAEDKLIPISVGETMHHDIPNSVFESVPGCGHLAPSECYKPVVAGTIEFLKSQPAMQGGEKTLPNASQ